MITEPEVKKRKVYNITKINELYKSIETHLTYQEKEIVKEIMGDFNNLVTFAREKKEYIKDKEQEWLDNVEENNKLVIENRELREKIENQFNTIIKLKKNVKT